MAGASASSAPGAGVRCAGAGGATPAEGGAGGSRGGARPVVWGEEVRADGAGAVPGGVGEALVPGVRRGRARLPSVSGTVASVRGGAAAGGGGVGTSESVRCGGEYGPASAACLPAGVFAVRELRVGAWSGGCRGARALARGRCALRSRGRRVCLGLPCVGRLEAAGRGGPESSRTLGGGACVAFCFGATPTHLCPASDGKNRERGYSSYRPCSTRSSSVSSPSPIGYGWPRSPGAALA